MSKTRFVRLLGVTGAAAALLLANTTPSNAAEPILNTNPVQIVHNVTQALMHPMCGICWAKN
jgi:hypothetical protein